MRYVLALTQPSKTHNLSIIPAPSSAPSDDRYSISRRLPRTPRHAMPCRARPSVSHVVPAPVAPKEEDVSDVSLRCAFPRSGEMIVTCPSSTRLSSHPRRRRSATLNSTRLDSSRLHSRHESTLLCASPRLAAQHRRRRRGEAVLVDARSCRDALPPARAAEHPLLLFCAREHLGPREDARDGEAEDGQSRGGTGRCAAP